MYRPGGPRTPDCPYKLDDELRAVIVPHGGTYVDILPDYRNMPNPEQYYFPVDHHRDAEGHGIIVSLLAKEISGGAVPALKSTPSRKQQWR
jgi:hypothetical protein